MSILRYADFTMRTVFLHVLMFSLLLTGVEGATDIAMDGAPHGTELSHEDDFGHSLEAHKDATTDGELNDDHCQHCCHGHSAGITGQFATTPSPLITAGRHTISSAHVRSLGQAPPTPPPNA